MLDLTKSLGNSVTTYSRTKVGEILDWCPTFFPQVDKTMLGGFPLSGKVTEIYGDPSVGKSTLVMTAIQHLINSGVTVVVFDVEGTTSKIRMQQLGIDTSNVWLPKHKIDKKGFVIPFSVEQIQHWVQIISGQAIKEKQPVVFVWDTIADTPSNAQIKAAASQQTVGTQARAIDDFFLNVDGDFIKQYPTLIVLNQSRANVNATNPYLKKIPITKGGKALDHAVSLKLLMKNSKKIKLNATDKKPIGHKARFNFMKSKIGGNWGSHGILDIIDEDQYGHGCDFVFNIYDEAKDEGLITGAAWQTMSYKGKTIKEHGSKGWISFLRSDKGKPVLNYIWQTLVKFLFPDCYPALFNQNVILDSKHYPFLKGMRAYYIKKQETLPKSRQNVNYLNWKSLHQNTVKKIAK